jgi:hypothetical protein
LTSHFETIIKDNMRAQGREIINEEEFEDPATENTKTYPWEISDINFGKTNLNHLHDLEDLK